MSKRRRPNPNPPSKISRALEEALFAFGAQRPDEAERLARYVLASSPDNVVAAQVLGHSLLQRGRATEAIDPLQAAAVRSKDPAIETLLAKILAAAGRGDEAIDRLRQTTARRPPFPLAFLELGDQLAAAGRFDEGIAVFENALALTPNATVLPMGLGYLHPVPPTLRRLSPRGRAQGGKSSAASKATPAWKGRRHSQGSRFQTQMMTRTGLAAAEVSGAAVSTTQLNSHGETR
jgi:tetratricopeptide (TPR) repeat protein